MHDPCKMNLVRDVNYGKNHEPSEERQSKNGGELKHELKLKFSTIQQTFNELQKFKL